MKKKLNEDTVLSELRQGSVFFRDRLSPAEVKDSGKGNGAESVSTPKRKTEVTQNPTQVSKRLSRPLSKRVSKPLSNLPTTAEIEDLTYALRREHKTRVNADIPDKWKEELDDMAHRLRVGKYELLLFVIAEFLEKVHRKGTS
jgi:hypothetical protein